jgi:ribosomal protein S18 acetylase RimI-like enzyme
MTANTRPYATADRAAVWSLAADTAFFGDPVETFLDDRALFCAAFVAYYTTYEPGRLWVAEIDGTVVGYVTGCGDTRRQTRTFRSRILPTVLWGVLRRRYRVGTKTLRFALRIAREGLQHSRPNVSLDRFPGHLHINVLAGSRGNGIGRTLLERSLAQFWATGVRGVHLSTTDHNAAACHLYEAVGFRLLHAWPTRLWVGLVDSPVERRIYGIQPVWD